MKKLLARHKKIPYCIVTAFILLWLLGTITTQCLPPLGDLLPPLATCYIGGGSCT